MAYKHSTYYQNDISNSRPSILFWGHGNGTECWYQNESSSIRLPVQYMRSGRARECHMSQINTVVISE